MRDFYLDFKYKKPGRIGNSTNDTIVRAHNNIYYKTEGAVKAIQFTKLVYISFSRNGSCDGSLCIGFSKTVE